MASYAELERNLNEPLGYSVPFSSKVTIEKSTLRTLLDRWAEAEARAMEGEFRLQHQVDGRAHLIWCSRCAMDDPRHKWVWADWLTAAREKLRRE